MFLFVCAWGVCVMCTVYVCVYTVACEMVQREGEEVGGEGGNGAPATKTHIIGMCV